MMDARHRVGKSTRCKKVTEGVIFIPHTPDSVLKRKLNEMEAEISGKTKIKYVEYLKMSVLNTVGRMKMKGLGNLQLSQ